MYKIMAISFLFFFLLTLLNEALNWFMLKTGQEKQSGQSRLLQWDSLIFLEPAHLVFHTNRGYTGIFTVQRRTLGGKSQLSKVIPQMPNLNPSLSFCPSNIDLCEYCLHFVISKVIMICSTFGSK